MANSHKTLGVWRPRPPPSPQNQPPPSQNTPEPLSPSQFPRNPPSRPPLLPNPLPRLPLWQNRPLRPRPSQIWAPRPRPSQIWVPRPRPSQIWAPRPRPSQVWAPPSRPSQVWAPRPRPSQVWVPRPSPSLVPPSFPTPPQPSVLEYPTLWPALSRNQPCWPNPSQNPAPQPLDQVLQPQNCPPQPPAIPGDSRQEKEDEDLALQVWNSADTISQLLQDITLAHRSVSPPTLSEDASYQVSNVIALFELIAAHPDTRIKFINASLTTYLYPFLFTTSKEGAIDNLRFATLRVICALVKVGNTETISYLLDEGMLPLCLRSIDNGGQLSKAAGAFIIHSILMDGHGFRYICAEKEQFFAVCCVLNRVVVLLKDQPSVELLKHILRCYWRLSNYQWSCWNLQQLLPKSLKDGTFNSCLCNDYESSWYLENLLQNVDRVLNAAHQGGNHLLM